MIHYSVISSFRIPQELFFKVFKISKLKNIFGLAFIFFFNISLGSVSIKCIISILGNLIPGQVLMEGWGRSHQPNLTPSRRLTEGNECRLQ